MIEALLRGTYSSAELHHVRMDFSRRIDEVGQLRLNKIIELLSVLYRIIKSRVFHQIRILYYPPAGPHRIPMWRDFAILLSTRWLFDRVIFHFHAGGISELYSDLTPLERWLFRKAYWRPDVAIQTSLAAPSDGNALKAKSVYFIPNGIEDVASLYASRRTSNSHSTSLQQRCRILYVGAIRESKGILTLIEACRYLHTWGVDFEVFLVGEFESTAFEHKVRAALDFGDLASRITFAGVLFGREKWKAYDNADIFCFPSHFEAETFGIVLTEAQCFSLPIVATRWRGIPTVVSEGKNAFLVPVKEPEALAIKLKELICNPSLRETMGKNSREHFLANFSIDRFWQRMDELFTEVGTDLDHYSKSRKASDKHSSAPPG